MSGIVHQGEALYANGDWSAVVPAGSPEAAFLLVGPGSVVPRKREELYRSHVTDAPASEPSEPDRVVISTASDQSADAESEADQDEDQDAPAAETPKPRKRAARRARSDD